MNELIYVWNHIRWNGIEYRCKGFCVTLLNGKEIDAELPPGKYRIYVQKKNAKRKHFEREFEIGGNWEL